jgi:hypothetical protein
MAKLSLHEDFDRYHIAYKQEVQLTGIMISIIFLFEKCSSVIRESLAIVITIKYKITESNVGQVRSYCNFDQKLTDNLST